MLKISILKIILIFSFTSIFGQNGHITVYEVVPTYDAGIANDKLYVPLGKERYDVKEWHVFNFGSPEKIGSYKVPVDSRELLFDGSYVYVHSTAMLSKYSVADGDLIWMSKYDHTGWRAQTKPKILNEKYIGVGVNDRVAVFDRKTGDLVIQVAGRGIAEGFSMSGEEMLIVSNDQGKNIAYDVNTGRQLWSKKVGNNGGFGSITEGNRIYLPSWEPYLFCLDKNTGKELWKIDMKSLSNGCGSGFSQPPHIVGDYLYTIHRDKGVFKFNKHTGKEVLNVNEFGDVVGDLLPYKDHFLFIDENNLYVYSMAVDQIIKVIELPVNVRSNLEIHGDVGLITNYTFENENYKLAVMTINLNQIIN